MHSQQGMILTGHPLVQGVAGGMQPTQQQMAMQGVPHHTGYPLEQAAGPGMQQMQMGGNPNLVGHPLEEVLTTSVAIALQGFADHWGQGPMLLHGKVAGCRLWPQTLVWSGDLDELVPYWLTKEGHTEYFGPDKAMKRGDMQLMISAFPTDQRQYARADGSCDPLIQVADQGNPTGAPEYFIGPIGSGVQSQPT